ncbi:hypothetical protein NESM_000095900 [Novymonas esmeraldas]|uniref:Uncharacterized protein n=1 Tax=Novymonas esmeraldas TaxID=1808958 RepID=A0AAW0F3N5_9TRYP
MSNFFRKLVLKTLVSEGSKTPLIQRMAEKAARAEHSFTGEKAGLWLGAAAREVSNDINASYNTVRSYLSSEAPPSGTPSATTTTTMTTPPGVGRDTGSAAAPRQR